MIRGIYDIVLCMAIRVSFLVRVSSGYRYVRILFAGVSVNRVVGDCLERSRRSDKSVLHLRKGEWLLVNGIVHFRHNRLWC